MPVKKDDTGRRVVQAEVEVPGSPEEVWRAIASGKGVSSWFVPTTIDGREGGTTVTSFGPGMDAVAKITSWNPPHSYVAETEDTPGHEGPKQVATEWIVEARAGGTCVVRVVHRWFADTDDWDAEFEGHAYGWATSFFRMLRLYLAHFPGEPCAAFQLSAMSDAPGPQTWRTLRSALTIDASKGTVASAPGAPGTPGAPELSGVVEWIEVADPELLRIRATSPQIVAALEGMGDEEPELLLRLDRPAPGVAHIFAVSMGEQSMVSLRFHFYGDHAAQAASDAKRAWNDWLADRFTNVTAQ